MPVSSTDCRATRTDSGRLTIPFGDSLPAARRARARPSRAGGAGRPHRLSRSMQQRSGPRARAAARKRAARARAREARGLLANEALGERRCIFLVSDVLSSDPLEIDSRTPGPGRADRRLGLVARRSAQSRLAGHHLQQLLVVEGEDDVEVVAYENGNESVLRIPVCSSRGAPNVSSH